MIMKPSRVLLAVLVGWLTAQAGCSRSASPSAGRPAVASARRVLSAEEAATLAARLANDQCERQHQKRPFRGEQYPAVLQDGLYRWGGLDVGGRGGLSARVTFRQDGSASYVEVYYSTDLN